LLGGIDLHEQAPAFSRAFHLFGERAGELWAIDRLDHIEQCDRIAHFVGLQRPDEMKLEITMAVLQFGPFGARLLHAVLAEEELACADRLLDRRREHGLSDGHEPPLRRIAIGGLRSESDLLPDQSEPCRYLARSVGIGDHQRLSTRVWPERNLTVPVIRLDCAAPIRRKIERATIDG